MASNAIRKQVDWIHEQGFKRLQELSIFVLLFQVCLFIEGWFGAFVSMRPRQMGVPNAPLIQLNAEIILLLAGLVFLFGSVGYFWRLRDNSQFHILFIERKEEQKQIDTKRFYVVFLIPVSVSIGLAFTTLSYGLYPGEWWSLQHPLWWSLEHTPLSWYPLLVVVCSSIVLSIGYLIKPERVQRSAPWLLLIPLILSICMQFYALSSNALAWYISVMKSTAFLPGSTEFTIDVMLFSFRTIFLASLIVLLYLVYSINAENGGISTLVNGEHLQGVIEEGVGILPKRVRAGDSHTVSLDLTLSKDFIARGSHSNSPYQSSDYLEAEIRGTGLDVEGDTRLRISETSPLLINTWNCCFTKSGIHTIDLRINVVKPDNPSDVIFLQQSNVAVDSLLSVTWAPVTAFMSPILMSVVQVFLKRIG